MTNPETEHTAGGVLGRIAGKAKETAGTVLGNDELAREGRLQQAQSEAEIAARREETEAKQREAEADLEAERTDTEAERERLRAEIAEQDREAEIERERQRAEQQAAAEAE